MAVTACSPVALPRGLRCFRHVKSCRMIARAIEDTKEERVVEGLQDAPSVVSDAPSSSARSGVRDNTPYGLLSSISGLGFIGTGYLTWAKLTEHAVACPVSGSCSSILDSSYAQILGIPLSLFGMLGYGSVALLAIYGVVLKSDAQPNEETLSMTRTLLALCSSVLAGTSLVLVATLLTKFPGTSCIYCLSSAAAAASLFALSYSSLPPEQRQGPGRYSLGSFVTTAALLGGIYATYPEPTIARMQFMEYRAPIVTQESEPGARDLAIRLRESGAKFFGAFWCGHCYEQKEMFGRDAAAELPYVECYPNGIGGGQQIEKVCEDAGVQGFPTWIINGQKVEGDWPLDYLSAVLDGADPKALAAQF